MFQIGNIILSLQSSAKHIDIRSFFFVLLLGLFACANPQPPSGGPPDTSPPIILETKPLSGTVNFEGDEAVIRFNKYMNRPKVIENIYISPPVKTKYSWSGKDLEIEFLEPFDSSLTYTVNLGTEYTDYLGNKPDAGFSLIFSSGSVIDSGSINGTLHISDGESAFVYAYRIDNIQADTLNVSLTMPIYRVQIGKSGKFSIKALADGIYRLIASRDVFRNNIYDEGVDAFGAAVADVIVRSDSTANVEFKLGPIIDKSGPMLYSVNSLNQRYIELTFSEDLDTLSVKPDAIIISDSLEKSIVNIKSVFFSAGSAKKVTLLLENPLKDTLKWRAICHFDSTGIRDISGNIVNDTANFRYFSPAQVIDTIAPVLSFVSVKDSSLNVALGERFDFVFNMAMNDSTMSERISLIDLADSSSKAIAVSFIMDNILRVSPLKFLDNDRWFSLMLDLTGFSSLSGIIMHDTIINIRFKTEDTRSYGSASGRINFPEALNGELYLNLTPESKRKVYQTKADKEGYWTIKDLPAGKYTIDVFLDENSNGKYDFGNAFPFRHSEKFKKYDIEINIKPRWDTEKINLTFD